MKKLAIFTLTFCLFCFQTWAIVKPNSLFSNNMVLQQGVAVPVWGTANENESVTVEFSGQKVSAVAKDGKWFVKLNPLQAGGPFEMTIKGQNTVKITNILVGEVWICGGQSNMARKIGVQAGQPDIVGRQEAVNEAVNFSHIRQFFVPLKGSASPIEDVNGSWAVCDSNSINDFTAVGYFFAHTLTQNLKNVPIGLISSSWGGTPAQKWASRASLEQNEELKYLVADYEKSILNYPADLKKYRIREDSLLTKWKIDVAKAKETGGGWIPKPAPPIEPHLSGNVGGLFNAMIAPLVPYAIKGVIWYQGESDKFKTKQYQTLFPLLIADWRKAWDNGDFPFLYVQVAPFNAMFPEIREAQLLCLKKTINTAMVVTTDCGEADKIHPGNKKPVGERLALAAQALAYNQTVSYSGPIYSSMEVKDNTIILSFEHINSGLIAKHGELTDFVICGADKKFVPAKATINGDKIIVSAEGITNPKAVRMGWANVPNVNLYNKEGLPASPFRTDF